MATLNTVGPTTIDPALLADPVAGASSGEETGADASFQAALLQFMESESTPQDQAVAARVAALIEQNLPVSQAKQIAEAAKNAGEVPLAITEPLSVPAAINAELNPELNAELSPGSSSEAEFQVKSEVVLQANPLALANAAPNSAAAAESAAELAAQKASAQQPNSAESLALQTVAEKTLIKESSANELTAEKLTGEELRAQELIDQANATGNLTPATPTSQPLAGQLAETSLPNASDQAMAMAATAATGVGGGLGNEAQTESVQTKATPAAVSQPELAAAALSVQPLNTAALTTQPVEASSSAAAPPSAALLQATPVQPALTSLTQPAQQTAVDQTLNQKLDQNTLGSKSTATDTALQDNASSAATLAEIQANTKAEQAAGSELTKALPAPASFQASATTVVAPLTQSTLQAVANSEASLVLAKPTPALAPHEARLDSGIVQAEILRMTRQGGGQVVLELTPPDQGRFRIDLKIDTQGVAYLIVEGGSESTRARLEQGASDLRQQLQEMGLSLQLSMRQDSSGLAQQRNSQTADNLVLAAGIAANQGSDQDSLAAARIAQVTEQGRISIYA